MKPIRVILILVISLAIQGVLFLLLPFAHALFFDYPERKQPSAEIVYEVETLVKKKPEQKPQKTIRRIQSPLKLQAPNQSQQRSFNMDLSLAATDASGEGVAVGAGGMGNVVYDPGEVDQEARVLQSVPQKYPKRAEREGISGYVKLYLIIDANGNPYGIQVLQVEPRGYGFELEAIKAMKQHKFKPAMLNNVPVQQKATKEFTWGAR